MYYGDVNGDNSIDMGDVLKAQAIADFNALYPPVAAGTKRWTVTYLAGYGMWVRADSQDMSGWKYIVQYDEQPGIWHGPLTEQEVLDQCGMTVDVLTRADVDGDGVVTQADAGLIQQYIMGMITQFPVEVVPIEPPAETELVVGGSMPTRTITAQGVIQNASLVSITCALRLEVQTYNVASGGTPLAGGGSVQSKTGLVLAKAPEGIYVVGAPAGYTPNPAQPAFSYSVNVPEGGRVEARIILDIVSWEGKTAGESAKFDFAVTPWVVRLESVISAGLVSWGTVIAGRGGRGVGSRAGGRMGMLSGQS